MSSNTVTNFKVFLRNSDTTEARRFSIDTDVVTCFVFVKEMLQSVFPVLHEANYKVTWKDADGDEITICSDEDLIIAMTEMAENPVKVLYVSAVSRPLDQDCMPEATCNHINRSMRKAAHHASRDARNFSSCNRKTPGGENASDSQPRPGCPFSAGQGINFENWDELAKKHLAPVFEALGIQQPTNEKTGGEAGPSVCADYINAALNHFLSNKPTSNDQGQADRPNEKKTQPSTSQNIPTAPPSQPMDVESEHSENANVAAAQERTQTFTGNSGVITIDDNEQRGTGPNQTSAIPSSNPFISNGLRQLHEMGFSNEDGILTRLLDIHGGNVANVVKALIEKQF